MSEAVPVYIGTKTLVFNSSVALEHVLKWAKKFDRHVLRHMTKLKIEMSHSCSNVSSEKLPYLKTLAIGVAMHHLEIGSEKVPWRDHYSDLGLVKIPVVAGLLQVRGLKKATITFEHFGLLQDSAKKKKAAVLQEQIQKLLSAVVTQPRDMNDRASHPSSVLELLTEDKDKKKRVPTKQRVREASDTDSMLTQDEFPATEADFARLFFSRPHAMYKWMQYAARHLNAHLEDQKHVLPV